MLSQKYGFDGYLKVLGMMDLLSPKTEGKRVPTFYAINLNIPALFAHILLENLLNKPIWK
jgi:hypothetical protein